MKGLQGVCAFRAKTQLQCLLVGRASILNFFVAQDQIKWPWNFCRFIYAGKTIQKVDLCPAFFFSLMTL